MTVKLIARKVWRRVGRVCLWATVFILLLRGGLSLFGQGEAQPLAIAAKAEVSEWPDQAAYAFAVSFARGYWSDRSRFVRRPEDVRAPEVVDVVPVGHEADGAARARITVLVTVRDRGGQRSVPLVVPVASARGALVVYDRPGLGVASVPAVAPERYLPALSGSDKDAIGRVLSEWFRAYLSGASQSLEYLSVPGARLRAVGGYRLVGALSVSGGPAVRDRQDVTVSLTARDAVGAEFDFRFRVVVQRGAAGRWYVARVF